MFLSILRISASIVTIVSIGCAVVISNSHKTTGSINELD